MDSHVPADVAEAVQKLQPSWSVEHVSSWCEGVWRNVDDDLLLEACHEDCRVLVSKDRRTLPGWVALRASEGKDHAGILFYDEERFPAPAIGLLAQAIVRVGSEGRDWRNSWITLR